MIGKPDQEVPFDCSQFELPVGSALSMKNVGVRCQFKNNSVDLPATICNCCDCWTSTVTPEVSPDLAVSMTDALKVGGSRGSETLIGDILKYSISVSVEACLQEQLRDIHLSHRIPRGMRVESTLQAINVQPKADAVCSLDPLGQQLTCLWTSITCEQPKRVIITGTATSAGTYKLCAAANTSTPGRGGQAAAVLLRAVQCLLDKISSALRSSLLQPPWQQVLQLAVVSVKWVVKEAADLLLRHE
eukprot:gene10956-11110_t